MDIEPLRIPEAARARSRRARLPLRLALLALAVLTAWFLREPIRASLATWQSPEVTLATAEPQGALALSALRGTAANGYVVAGRRAALSADAPGRIVELRVEEGSRVEAGELVARLYQDELRAALEGATARVQVAEAEARRQAAQVAAVRAELAGLDHAVERADATALEAKAQRDLASRERDRAAQLFQSNNASERERDRAQTEWDAAKAREMAASAAALGARAERQAAAARVELAEAALVLANASVEVALSERNLAKASLEKTEVRAPFAGIVVLKDAEVGEVVSPNVQGGANARGAICTMVDLESLEVQVEVPESSLSRVLVGAPARVFLDAYPDAPYLGRVARIWPTANRQKGTVEVRVAFDQRDDRLRPELGLRVVFLSEQDLLDEAAIPAGSEPLLVPKEALVERGGARGVQIVEDSAVRFVPLELGPERFQRILVHGGLSPGDRYLLPSRPELTDGARVRVRAQ